MNATLTHHASRIPASRSTGIVKWFNTTLGYGFIHVTDDVKETFNIDPESDLFFHGRNLTGAVPFPRKLEGMPCAFTVVIGKKGPCATDVEISPESKVSSLKSEASEVAA